MLALVAMRSDAFPQLQSEPSLAALPKDTFTLDMMLEGSYRNVIEEPARLVRPNPLKIDPQLVEALLEDISGQDALPLLAFTLAHLYEHYAADNELTLSGYEKLGRLNGVIGTTVKDAFAEGVAAGQLPKDPKAQLALARAAFIPHLAQVNATGQFIRRVATRDEIPAEAKPLIDRFAERRLLIRDRRKIAGVDAEVIEVAHETLLRQPPFSEWLAEDRDFLIWRERLSQARAAFEANQRGRLSGRELELARDWVQRRAAKDIAAQDQKFINDSIAEDNKRRADEAKREREREATELEARQARKLRRAVIAASIFAVDSGRMGDRDLQNEVVEQGATSKNSGTLPISRVRKPDGVTQGPVCFSPWRPCRTRIARMPPSKAVNSCPPSPSASSGPSACCSRGRCSEVITGQSMQWQRYPAEIVLSARQTMARRASGISSWAPNWGCSRLQTVRRSRHLA